LKVLAMNPILSIYPSGRVEKGSPRGYRRGSGELHRKNKKNGFRWMGCTIVEIVVPQVKTRVTRDESSSALPRAKRGCRSHRTGPRTSRMGRSTVRGARREVDNLRDKPPRRPGTAKSSSARVRFVNWVDRHCGRLLRLMSRDIVNPESWIRWEASDFDPTKTPYRGDVVRHGVKIWRSEALRYRHNVLRRIAAVYKKPPPWYLERGMTVRLRTWRSAGLSNPDGHLVSETDRWLARIPNQGDESLRFCSSCGRRFWAPVQDGRLCRECASRIHNQRVGRATQRRGRPRRGR
jgi:hypothetical protein